MYVMFEDRMQAVLYAGNYKYRGGYVYVGLVDGETKHLP
jgi:hypothetical protein